MSLRSSRLHGDLYCAAPVALQKFLACPAFAANRNAALKDR
jgi:hypothetical protein